jgi:hypothetical protein
MSRPVRIALGVLVGALAIVGFGIGYTLLVGGRPDIGNPDFATVKQTLPGKWNLQETSQAVFIAGLVDEFDEADLRSQISDLGIGDPVRISLTFTQDTISAGRIAEDTTAEIGSGTYRLVDNHTLFVTRGDCQVRAQIRLRDDLLTFGIIDPCPTELSDITLAVLLRGAPFMKAASP